MMVVPLTALVSRSTSGRHQRPFRDRGFRESVCALRGHAREASNDYSRKVGTASIITLRRQHDNLNNAAAIIKLNDA